MSRMIFVNFPVTDLARSRAFYQALGFSINEQFSGDSGACVLVSEAICFMILTHDQFRDLSPKPMVDPQQGTTALISLTCDSRAEVDRMTEAAIAAGGADAHPPEDLGFMYSRAFHDPDGNAFGLFWMKPDQG
ncbi:VOC family protein [Paracoccaceae bacterium]